MSDSASPIWRRYLPEPWRWPWIVGVLSIPIIGVLLAWPLLGMARSTPETVWGRHGVQHGDFHKPRAAAIDAQDRLYVVDFTARIQAFDRDGKLLCDPWSTPDWTKGRPSGLSIDRDGNLLVSDSHYHCLQVYKPDGTWVKTIRLEYGTEPGKVAYITDAVQDEDRNYYLGEFGQNQRITKLNENGAYVTSWGAPGMEPGQFSRIRALALGPKDKLLYVADACNHRIQAFTREGKLVRHWGTAGSEPGQLRYPYDLAFNAAGDLYVIEHGNHRVQKFTAEGEALGCWGVAGREVGQLDSPWALAVDSRGRVHVIDTGNHRVQRINF